MERERFWDLIDGARAGCGGDQQRMIERLFELLKPLPVEEIVSFDRHTKQLTLDAYRWDLWGAAYVINGGCSDDMFEYFRRWLIANGREFYEGACRDPDGFLAARDFELLCEHMTDFEMLIEPARLLFEKHTGDDLGPEHEDLPMKRDPDGEAWDEDGVEKLYPKLAARFWPRGLTQETARVE